jgi:hypothetical protein
MRINQKSVFLILILTGLCLNACDESLDPFKENDRFIFSMYGYVDASDGTNWIRVINLQEEVDRTGRGINGTVTLENLSTGETAVLEDSLFQYSANIFAYNFRTDKNLEPGGTYRLTAVRFDGAESSVIINIPDDFREPEFRTATFPGEPDGLRIWEVDNLAEASVRFNVRYVQAEITQRISVSLLPDTIQSGSDQYLIPVESSIISDATVDLDDVEITDCEFYVAKAGPEWVDFSSIDRNLIALPEGGISNVENGTGYVVGVVSRRIKFPNVHCTDQEEEN